MKLAFQVQLLPDAETVAKLKATVERFNEAATWLAGVAFEHQTSSKFALQKLAYRDLREKFGLLADMTIRCIARVCDAYNKDKTRQPEFRKHSAVPFSMGKNIGFKGPDHVSILALDGRAVVPFIMGKYQADRFTLKKGQTDLLLRKDGKWFLVVTVETPEAAPVPAIDFIGVDLGIANIATDSDPDSKPYSGETVEKVRRKHNLQRKRLGKRNTKGAKKKLKRIASKEARFKKHENHCISKAIVQSAERSNRGIALEDLKGIRSRVKARGGDARNRLGGWGFAQLGRYIAYKSQLSGVEVVYVDPAYTSQTCSACGHCEKANRKTQGEFSCKACGMSMNADRNAALNIRFKALAARKPAIELVSLSA